ncbi:MAG: hypothetical protein JXE06_08160 [Coriobacteriia bacterium]|nr:hypothetical protein [Coriobacteriia bacterium]
MRHRSRTILRAIGLIAVGVLIPGVVFAGGQSGGMEPASQEKMTITWFWWGNADGNPTYTEKLIEEMFNVEIEVNRISYFTEKEKASLAISTGQFPDFGFAYEDPLKMWTDGITRSIPHEMIKKYAPKYAQVLDDTGVGWLVTLNPDNPEEKIGLPGVSAYTKNQIGQFMVFREDWARKGGLALPGYEDTKMAMDLVPKTHFYDHDYTLEEVEAYLAACRDEDLDGNGKDDTIPLGACNSLEWSFLPYLNALGLHHTNNYESDGKILDYCVVPQYKEFLRLMAKWYKMGLIDKEFPTIDVRKKWEKEGLGLVGMTGSRWNYVVRDGINIAAPNSMAKNEENVDVIMTWPPTGFGGSNTRVMGAYSLIPLSPAHCGYVNKSVSDAKLARILQIFDWLKGTDEGWVASMRGQEGVHFDWEGEAWNSRPVYRKEEDRPAADKDGRFDYYPAVYSEERTKFLVFDQLLTVMNKYIYAGKGPAMLSFPARVDFFNETGYADKQLQYADALNTTRDEFYMKAITGEVDIDAEWDAYVSRWLSLGGKELMAELAKAPKAAPLRLEGKRVY